MFRPRIEKEKMIPLLRKHKDFNEEWIKEIEKEPLAALENSLSETGKKMANRMREVQKEYHRQRSFLRLDCTRNNLVSADVECHHHVEMMILKHLHERFPGKIITLHSKLKKLTYIYNETGYSTTFESVKDIVEKYCGGNEAMREYSVGGSGVGGSGVGGSGVGGSGVGDSGVGGSEVGGSGVGGSGVGGSGVGGSRVDGSRVDGSRVDGSRVDGSRVDGSGVDGSGVDGSGVGGSESLYSDISSEKEYSVNFLFKIYYESQYIESRYNPRYFHRFMTKKNLKSSNQQTEQGAFNHCLEEFIGYKKRSKEFADLNEYLKE